MLKYSSVVFRIGMNLNGWGGGKIIDVNYLVFIIIGIKGGRLYGFI